MPKPPRTSDEIRQAYLDFFQQHGHQLLPPWPLVPIGDPTSLFTSAGMQQFKPYFLGEQAPPTNRAVSVQRCLRTTDIEVVGDYSHLTCFEMMGNFSFGDYFKQGAIEMAWELITKVYQMDPERIHVTTFLTDEISRQHWREVGLPDSHIHERDEDLNYWFSFPNGTPGASGPCGPDSEIYYDFYPERGVEGARWKLDALGKPEPGVGVGYDDERFLEFWNLVFMQLYQSPDGSREDLPAQNIDTGSGLERVAIILQDKRSIYETDIFMPIVEVAAAVVGVDYFETASDDQAYAIRAMSEHCRAATLLVGDGVVPSNEGRGYILRRILRRAIYFARKNGVREPFTARLAEAAIAKLKGAYPHLEEQADFIKRALNVEEERFIRTLAHGSARLETLLERLRETASRVVPGEEAFLLYDSFGLPLELTREIAGVEGFSIDDGGFQAALEAQRAMSRASGKFLKGEVSPAIQALGDEHSDFLGYNRVEIEAHVAGIIVGDAIVAQATTGQACSLILSATAFYPEGGGQVGDRGNIRTPSGVFMVEDTQATGGAILHRGRVSEGEIRVAQSADASVDLAWRAGSTRNHTGTHLLHAGLRAILGTHVRQQGSLVSPERLRFDFTHLEQTPREALLEVQQLVNDKVRRNLEVAWRRTGYRQAVAAGALAFFGDKYGDEVRVVEIKDDGTNFSAELCGGTHVDATGEIGYIHILRETAVAAGTRRIEALTGRGAELHLLEQQERLIKLAEKLSAAPADLEDRFDALQADLERLRRQGEQLQHIQSATITASLAETAQSVGEVRLVVSRVVVTSPDALKEIADRLRQQLGSSLVVLAAVVEGKPSFIVAATPDLVGRGVHSGNLIREIAKAAGGGGGGRPDMATAGAKDPNLVDAALDTARQLASAALGA